MNVGAMSKDRVQFYLPSRYFMKWPSSNKMSMDDCKEVLGKAFDLRLNECGRLMDENPDGFTVVCRPSQFARFIIFRHMYGQCINGVRDLRPELLSEEDLGPYVEVARKLHMDLSCVKKVARALGFVSDEPKRDMIDVSGRLHVDRC